MTHAAISGMYKRMAAGKYKNQMVPHGWRAALSTIMNERAAELKRDGDRMLIDAILSHVPLGVPASEGAYNRARYLASRGELLQIWADTISKGLADPTELGSLGAVTQGIGKKIVDIACIMIRKFAVLAENP